MVKLTPTAMAANLAAPGLSGELDDGTPTVILTGGREPSAWPLVPEPVLPGTPVHEPLGLQAVRGSPGTKDGGPNAGPSDRLAVPEISAAEPAGSDWPVVPIVRVDVYGIDIPAGHEDQDDTGRVDVYGIYIPAYHEDLYDTWFAEDADPARARLVALDEFYNVHKKAMRDLAASEICRGPIPREFRGRCWSSWLHVGSRMDMWPGHYGRLCESTDGVTQDIAGQIDLDVPRTYLEKTATRPGFYKAMTRILLAYATRNPKHGYTQGQNYIVGTLLLFMDEEPAFWGFCTICEEILARSFTVDIVGSIVDGKIFEFYANAYLPKLQAHLRAHGIVLAFHTLTWFSCLYTKTLPPETAFRVWDDVIRNGVSAMIEYGLRILRILRPRLLELTEEIKLNTLLMEGPRRFYDFSQLREQEIRPALTNALIGLRRDAFHERLRRKLDSGGSPW